MFYGTTTTTPPPIVGVLCSKEAGMPWLQSSCNQLRHKLPLNTVKVPWIHPDVNDTYIHIVTFWAALSPWIVRNGFVVAVWSGDAWVPASKLLMGICVAPEICNCCTSGWWWWWCCCCCCCCCTSWYRRAWCCSLNMTVQEYSSQSFNGWTYSLWVQKKYVDQMGESQL